MSIVAMIVFMGQFFNVCLCVETCLLFHGVGLIYSCMQIQDWCFLNWKPQCLKRKYFCVSNFGYKKGWWFLNWNPRCLKHQLLCKVKLFDQLLSTFSIQTSILSTDE